jgi:hypothetical protein
VAWRDGVHIVGTPLWCDARRARAICFMSRYQAIPAPHGQPIATAETLALYGSSAARAGLAPAYAQPFSLGTVRLELVRSGAGLGAASLLLDVDGTRILYAGRVGRGGLGGECDVRGCEGLVLTVDHDLTEPSCATGRAAAWVLEHWEAAGRRGGATVVLVASALDGLELLVALAPAGAARAAPAALRALAGRARTLVPGLVVPRPITARARARDLVVWAVDHPRRLDRLALPAGSRRLTLVGTGLAVDDALPWRTDAGPAEAAAYAAATGATRVFVTGRGARAAAAHVGAAVRVLGPPEQMRLF